MSFFTDGPRERPLFPVRERELFAYEGRPWMGPPSDHIVPAVLPWTRPLGRSERTIIALRGVDVWPEALTLRLAVYSPDSLEEGRTGSLIDHRRVPDYNALLVGVLYPDGSRASSESISVPSASEPDHPVLRAHGCGGSPFHLDHQVFVWPLPSDGAFTVVVQWLDRDIKETHTELDGAAIRAAATEAGELWPGLPKRPGNGVAFRAAPLPHEPAPAEEPVSRRPGGQVAAEETGSCPPTQPGPADQMATPTPTQPSPTNQPATGTPTQPSPTDQPATGRPTQPSPTAEPSPAEPSPTAERGPADRPATRARGASPLPRRTPADPGRPRFAPPKGPAEDPLVRLPRFGGEVAAAPEPLPQPSPKSPPEPLPQPQPKPPPEPLPQPSRPAGSAKVWPVDLPQPSRRRDPGG